MGGPPGWEFGEVLTTPHHKNKRIILRVVYKSLGPGRILWYDLSNGERTRDLVLGMLGACIGQVYSQQQPGN